MIEKELFRFELIKPAKIDKNKINTNGGIQELVDVEIRSCGNCKYFTSSPNTNKYDCCEKGIADTSISFCCNKWESK